MLDFFFGNDPLKEMEKTYKRELEETLKIKERGDDDAYQAQVLKLEKLKQLIEEYRINDSELYESMEEE